MVLHPIIPSIYSFIGYEKIVQMLIEKRVNINAVDDDNTSALMLAAVHGNTQNIFDCNKISLLIIINQFNIAGHKRVVEVLIDNMADTNIVHKFNNTALVLALDKGILQ